MGVVGPRVPSSDGNRPGFSESIIGPFAISIIDTPSLQVAGDWLRRNLGMSVLPFGITLALYIHTLRSLAQKLAEDAPQNEVAQQEHLADVWTSLFFGIGVIWTAIGMRSALLYAIGNPDVAAQAGAFVILERLVDGGILTALTTTIVGGIGGYLMRVYKAIGLGTRLQARYDEEARADTSSMRDSLQRIEQHLHAEVQQ